MKFVLESKTNKGKSTETFPNLTLLKTPYIWASAMPRAKKRSAKGSNFKEDEEEELVFPFP